MCEVNELNWIDCTVMIIRLLLVVCGALIGFIANRYYRRGQYQQAIYGVLLVIFIAICIR